MAPKLILASASPRRKDLLQQLGLIPSAIIPADIDETPQRDELPKAYAKRMAREKAEAIGEDGLILSADTVVAVGRRILPKTEEPDEARACLDLMSGRAHRIYGGICLKAGDRTQVRLVETRVQFKRLSTEEREAYIATGEWRGKAGGYAIQGMASAFVLSIQGSYTNVVGLSLPETFALLNGAGLKVTDQWPS